MQESTPELTRLILKSTSAFHPLGLLCNFLLLSTIIASIMIAIFKGKVVGALLLVLSAFVIRAIVMWVLRLYLFRKYR